MPTCSSILMTIYKRRKSDPFSTSVCSDGGGYLTSDHWGIRGSLRYKTLRNLSLSLWLYHHITILIDQNSCFSSAQGYNNYSYLGYNAAGVTGGYQVDWMKSCLHSYWQSQIQCSKSHRTHTCTILDQFWSSQFLFFKDNLYIRQGYTPVLDPLLQASSLASATQGSSGDMKSLAMGYN